jgi:hypothetical protein
MLINCMLAGCAGVIGCLVGGTPAFIMLGLAGIISFTMASCGLDNTWFQNNIVNLMLLPAIIFDADVVSVAYTAKKHKNINGYDTWRSLAYTSDVSVLFVGFLTGVVCYLFFYLVSYLNVSCDCGALTVLSAGILTRLFLSTDKKYKEDGLSLLSKLPKNVWLFQIFFSAAISFVFAYFTEVTGYYMIGFYVSALSLIIILVDADFPVTHHITLVTGYTMMMTHNYILAIIFGILSQLMCYVFTIVFNDKCSTHIDPPTVPILFFSFILFTFF